MSNELENAAKEALDKDYQLIPMSDITDEARLIAVRWMECEDKNWIGQKHKLASDIMNYARRHSQTNEQGKIGETKQYGCLKKPTPRHNKC